MKAMGFYHSDGFTAAYNQASKWMGKDGRIATLPDIINARINKDIDNIVWNRYYTTLSAEYVGLSREGKRLLVVAHGIGPMSTLEGIQKAYSWEYKDKTRSKRGGRITQQEFWDLINGKYGEVEIVDFDDYVESQRFPFIGAHSINSLRMAPSLLYARLGKNAKKFAEKIAKFSRQWHRIKAELNPYDDYFGPQQHPEYVKLLRQNINSEVNIWNWQIGDNKKFEQSIIDCKSYYYSMWGYMLPREIAKLRIAQQYWNTERAFHIAMGANDSDPVVLCLEGANNCTYGYNPTHFKEEINDVWKMPLEDGYAFAHLLSIGSIDSVNRGGIESKNVDIGCFEWWNGVRLAAIRNNYDIKNDDIIDGPNARHLLNENWDKCMIPIENPIDVFGMCGIMKVQDKWFTMTAKKGETMDTHTPEYLVKTVNPISSTIFRTIAGYQGDPFFRFGINEICKIAPIEANAYRFISEPQIIYRDGGLPPFHDCEIEFYKITIDSTKRLMTQSQLEKDFDKMLELMNLS